jgi:DNA-binding HxlR family transcriptional regulator
MKVPEIVEIELGEPWKLRENGAALAIPLLLKKGIHRERGYRLLSEVEQQVKLLDTGRIDSLQVLNSSNDAVFIRKGSIVKGNTQTRAITISIVVAPKSKTTAEIKCVFASKGIRGGSSFSFSDKIAPMAVEASLRASQGETWNRVRDYTTSTLNKLIDLKMAPSPAIYEEALKHRGTDDLEGYLGAEEKIIDEAMKNIPVDNPRQVGLVVVDINGIAGLEIFDHPDSWRVLSRSVTKNYAEILAQMASDIFDINIERAKQHVEEHLKKLQKMDGTQAYGEGAYKTYEISSDDITGEFTTVNGTLIHILATRRENQRPSPPPYPDHRVIPLQSINRNYDPRLENNKISMSLGLSEVNENKPPAQSQADPAATVEYLTKKRGYETIIALKESSKTFNELQKSTGMSTATVTKALKEAEELRIIHRSYRSKDASTVYELTEDGKKLEPRKFKATLED